MEAKNKEKELSEFYICRKDMLVRYFTARLKHPDEAEDLVQDVFVKLWEYRDFIRPDALNALAFTVARHVLIGHVRKDVSRTNFCTRLHQELEQQACTTDMAQDFKELQAAHEHAFQQLPAKRRLIYYLSFFEGHDAPGIARELSLSPRTVEHQILLARRSVRTYIRETYCKCI